MPISDIEEGLEEIRNGRMVILVNEESPDSDGFFCIPAEKATAENVNHMLRYGRGVIYLALTDERIRELGIVLIPPESSTFAGLLFGAAFSVHLEGVHGISAKGRAHTIQSAVSDTTRHEDLVIPGHVQPIQARSGGVLARLGRAEASVDLARLGGFKPAGVICHILEEDGNIATLPSLERLAEQQGLKILSVANLIGYRLRKESLSSASRRKCFRRFMAACIRPSCTATRSISPSIWRWSKEILGEQRTFSSGSIRSVLPATCSDRSAATAATRSANPLD